MQESSEPAALKPLYLLDPDLVFLNHGSFGACPAEVLAVQQGWQREMERNPVAFLGRRSAGLLAQARARLAQELGADPAHLVFVPNATQGVNTVARSLPLQPGDEILSTDHEYGACDNTWDWVCARTGARRVAVPIPLPYRAEEFVERVWRAVTPRTRVLFLSHMTSTTALIFPIQELVRRARAAGIWSVIDGAHIPGHLPLDLDGLGADFYTGNCHKWMGAPKGAAFLHARPEQHELLHALTISWGYSPGVEGHTGLDAYLGHSLLERRLQWQGTRDISAFLTVPAAIDFAARHDWARVRARCHTLAVQTLQRVCAHTGLAPLCRDEDFGQMVAIPVPPMNAEALKTRLFDDFRIEVPVTQHGPHSFVRASFQGYNSPADADALVAALQAIF